MLGYRIYKGVESIDYTPPCTVSEDSVKSDVRHKHDDILDMIYCRDPLTNIPCGTISQYLSDKTSDEVRQFIERNLLVDLPDNSMDVPSSLRDDLLSLDSEFIAKVSRNSYESKEDYEHRVEGYFREMEADKEKMAFAEKLRKKYAQERKS